MFGEVSSNSCHSSVLYSDIYSDWKRSGVLDRILQKTQNQMPTPEELQFGLALPFIKSDVCGTDDIDKGHQVETIIIPQTVDDILTGPFDIYLSMTKRASDLAKQGQLRAPPRKEILKVVEHSPLVSQTSRIKGKLGSVLTFVDRVSHPRINQLIQEGLVSDSPLPFTLHSPCTLC